MKKKQLIAKQTKTPSNSHIMGQHTLNDIEFFYTTITDLYFHELEFCISATQNVKIDGWLGAVLRNNLIFAAEKIIISNPISLRYIINTSPIAETHPLHSKLKGGFPKGYVINLLSHQKATSRLSLKQGDTVRFSIVLFGNFSCYYTEFVLALEQMCKAGLGHPKAPFHLDIISECQSNGIHYIWPDNWQKSLPSLQTPIRITDFINSKFKDEENEIEIHYPVPLNLYNNTFKKKKLNGSDRMNGFPGFYQLIRSLADRMVKLTALYIYPDNPSFSLDADACIDSFIEYAASVTLSSAQLKLVNLYSTPKAGTSDRIRFTGYIGKTAFCGFFNYYIPLLLFARHVGAGYNTVYGLGQYEIKKGEYKI